jgi:hypothetical protein
LCPPAGGYEPNELLPIIIGTPPRDIFLEELLSSAVNIPGRFRLEHPSFP